MKSNESGTNNEEKKKQKRIGFYQNILFPLPVAIAGNKNTLITRHGSDDNDNEDYVMIIPLQFREIE